MSKSLRMFLALTVLAAPFALVGCDDAKKTDAAKPADAAKPGMPK